MGTLRHREHDEVSQVRRDRTASTQSCLRGRKPLSLTLSSQVGTQAEKGTAAHDPTSESLWEAPAKFLSLGILSLLNLLPLKVSLKRRTLCFLLLKQINELALVVE